MGVDDLATQGARASSAMIMTLLNRDNSVPARRELQCISAFAQISSTHEMLIISKFRFDRTLLYIRVGFWRPC